MKVDTRRPKRSRFPKLSGIEHCNICGVIEDLVRIFTTKSGLSYHRCRKCQSERYQSIMKNPEKRNKYNESVKKSQRKYPEKRSARSKLQAMISFGKLHRPQICSVCGLSKLKIQAHHIDYSKPLEVIWLCSSCHSKKHHP